MTDVPRHADSELVRAIEEHAARNRALLAQLLELGTSLSEPHVIDCQFRAPTREAAGHLVEKLVARGFTDLSTVPGASDRPWGVEGTLHEAPEFIASPEITEELLRLAATCSATYDGWRPSVGEATEP